MRRLTVLAVFTLFAFSPAALAQTPVVSPTVVSSVTPQADLHAVPHQPLHTSEIEAQGDLTRTNVKLDLTITDTYTTDTGGTPAEKTVSMLVLHDNAGMIRTSNRLPNGMPVGLNVDASVDILDADLVRVRVTFEYTPAQMSEPAAERPPNPAELNESLTVVLRNGEPLVVSQSADPATDRTVTVKLTATVLR